MERLRQAFLELVIEIYCCGKASSELKIGADTYPRLKGHTSIIEVAMQNDRIGNYFLGKPASRISDLVEVEHTLTTRLVLPFLGDYFSRSMEGTTGPDEATLDIVFEEIRKSIERGHLETLMIAPLLHFTMEVEELILEDGLMIRRATSEEVMGWRESDTRLLHDRNFNGEATILEFAIVRKCIDDPVLGVSIHTVDTDIVHRIVSLIRLLTSVNVQSTHIEKKDVNNSFSGGTRTIYGYMIPYVRPATIDRVLSDRLAGLWRNINRVSAGGRFELALGRYGRTFERGNDDDTLLDYWIALEALFVPKNEGETTLRARLRIAHYLGETPPERLEIYSLMGRSYSLRSKVAHGSSAHGKCDPSLTRRETISHTGVQLKRALLKCLDSGTPVEPDDFERQLLSIVRPTDVAVIS